MFAKINKRGYLGLFILCLAALLAVKLFWGPATQEVGYQVKQIIPSDVVEKPTTPADTDFGIMINKIGANSRIIADVNPNNSALYQRALTSGVAHALGTGKPGEGKNIFLFAHSSGDLLTASRYNSIFYLLHHLELGDSITLWYQGKSYSYVVSDKSIVSPSTISALASTTPEKLTLMTCWPPGTTFNRLLITATLNPSL